MCSHSAVEKDQRVDKPPVLYICVAAFQHLESLGFIIHALSPIVR